MGEMPCSLHRIRVRAEVGRVVPLRFPGSADLMDVHMLRHDYGNRTGIFTDNGWMLVSLPGKDGFYGLPLEGERGSWHAAWLNENIQIGLCIEGQWVDIEGIDEWANVRKIAARN
jgi:hypothetical protein